MDKSNEIAKLRKVCAEAYQFAGAYNAPIKVLDNLSDAANGDELRHETFLPVNAPDWVIYEDALRELACYVGSGGWNADSPFDADVFKRKIIDGIDAIVKVQMNIAKNNMLNDLLIYMKNKEQK